MKFSTLQEQEYGVGLPQSQLLADTASRMDDSISMEPRSNPLDEGSVISNLPLLFANGYPTSLEKITLTQLERFVTFMVQCSLGHDTVEAITEPQWWPKEVKFSNPLTRPKRITDNWLANLKKLVFRCYTYHRSEYLLRFCSYLARYTHKDLKYVKNWDSTTSLFHKTTGKLLVTFRDENMNYDKKIESPRKKLLAHGSVSHMVRPLTQDIYLCDNCDAEFIGLEKMKEHERRCCEQEQTRDNSRPETPDLSAAGPELRQDTFLEYFRLCSRTPESKSIETNSNPGKNGGAERSSRRVRGSLSFTRYSSIPFSSPAGLLLSKKSKIMTEETQQERLERVERHLLAPVLSNSSRPKWLEAEFDNDRWVVTHKPNREKRDDYVHEYKFVNSVKRKPMLSIHSQLLYIVCRPVYVLLTRLSQEQINNCKRDAHENMCLDQKDSVYNRELKTKYPETLRPYVSSKRKAPSDEIDANVNEESERILNDNATVEDLTFLEMTRSCDDINTSVARATEETIVCPKLPDTIMIDLCSSDDETCSHTTVSSDENRDPMNYITGDMTQGLLQKTFTEFSSTKLHVKSHVCSTDQTNEWLSDNILSESSKYRSSMLNTHINLSPILRPAP